MSTDKKKPNKLQDTLLQYISQSGVSGHEEPIRSVVRDSWAPLTDRFEVSPLGNLYGIKQGEAKSTDTPRRRIALAVHMDGIGLVIERIVGEQLYFAGIGGFDPRILPGQEVIIHAESGPVPGVIVQLAPHLLSEPYTDEPVPMKDLVIDTGLGVNGVRERIRPGDVVSYGNLPFTMGSDCVAGHSLDNRASVAAVTHCLTELQRLRHEFDVIAVGTVQEEVAHYAGTVIADMKPDIAIVIDVTFASGPGADDHRTHALGSGPSIGIGANIHPKLAERLVELAKEIDLPYTIDPLPNMSGTDAVSIQNALDGVLTAVVSIPLRYMHTPVEVITMKDIARTGRLLAEFISRLNEEEFLTLKWEDETEDESADGENE